MSSRLSVVFYIILCIELGIALIVLPWIPYGWLGLSLSDWGNNYFLVTAARKTGFSWLPTVVASGWVRGAVSGLGVLNLAMGFWELFHFRQTVQALDAGLPSGERSRQKTSGVTASNAVAPAKTDPLSDYPRRDH